MGGGGNALTEAECARVDRRRNCRRGKRVTEVDGSESKKPSAD